MAVVGYFPATLAVDSNTGTRLRNAEAQVFAMTDTSFTTPLAITDVAGVPFTGNKLISNSDGIYPEFKPPAGVTQVIVKSGQALTPMTSIGVAAEAAEAAAVQATSAAADAGNAKTDAVQAKDDAVIARQAAEAVGATTDAQMAAIQASPTSAFAVAQKAKIAATVSEEAPETTAWFLDAWNAFLSGWPFVSGQGTSATSMTAAAASGDSTLAVASGSSFPNGTVLVIAEGTAQQHVNRVASGGGTNTLTLTKPLAFAVPSGAAVTPLWGDNGHMNSDANRAGWKAFARFIMEARRPDGTRVINRSGKVVFLGNSWMTVANSAIYTDAVHAVYPNAPVVIAGISGNNTAQILARFDTDCPADADFVVIPEPGVNASASESRAVQMQNLNTLINKVRAIGATPIFTGPVPVSTNLPLTAQQEADQSVAFQRLQYPAIQQTTPYGAVGYGPRALENATSDTNTAAGTSALRNTTTGAQNTAVGQYAGLGNTTGSFNSALGQGALQANQTGGSNTAIGRGALGATTASNSTAVGDQALNVATSGTGNTALGRQAGGSVTTGAGNVFAGASAGQAPNFVAGNATTTGSSQTVIGAYAGQGSSGASDRITAVGNAALASGTGATSVGAGAQALNSRAVAIGSDTKTTYVDQVSIGTRHMEMLENAAAAPNNGAAGSARIFVRDNGSGKKQLAVIFPSGSAITLATEA